MLDKITVSKLSKGFSGCTVLDQISFEATPGTVLALVGSSGAGKSTLLRCLCRLEVPDAGAIELNGKKIGVIFQQFHLWKHLSLLQNCILAPMHVLKKTKDTAIQEAKTLLVKMGLWDKKDHFPQTLSGGEQQRAAIVRSLLMHPEVLLFDEPTSALDPERTNLVTQMIRGLANAGLIILVVTHDLVFASQVATRVLFLEAGNILEDIPIHNHIISPKTERFLNFLKEAL